MQALALAPVPAPSLVGRPPAKGSKRPNSTIAVGVGEGELWAVIFYIFEENHRFSNETSHPEPHSVVDAANLAASSHGSQRMSNGDAGPVSFIPPAAGYPGILIGSAPATGEFDQQLFGAFQVYVASHVLYVAASSPIGDAE